MGFLSRLFRFVFWVLIVSWVIKLVGRVLTGGSHQSPTPGTANGPAGKRLVKDPVCGMHMAEELALPLSANGETQYFCSENCRSKFANGILPRAANA